MVAMQRIVKLTLGSDDSLKKTVELYNILSATKF